MGTANADTFNATHLTFGANDVLVGGAGTDTLKIVNSGNTAFSTPAAQVSEIETIKFQNINGTTAVAAVRETGTVTVAAMSAGQTLTVGGQTLLATANLTAANAAAALAGTATTGTGFTLTAAGTLTGFTKAAGTAGTNTVVYTSNSTTDAAPVADLVVAGTAQTGVPQVTVLNIGTATSATALTYTYNGIAVSATVLASVLTDRVLGQSISSTVPNRMMLILTGNNLTLQGEMPRRVLVCRIDPEIERPFSRHFELEPFGYCRANRQRMIASALTLIRAFYAHGINNPLNGRLASFEDWDECVRHSVSYANELMPDMFGDVMDSIVANQTADPELETLTIFLKAWFDAFPTRAISASELITSVSGILNDTRLIQLKKAIEDLPLGNQHQLSSKSIGRYLGYRKGRVAGGLVLEPGLKVNERQTWRVKRVGGI